MEIAQKATQSSLQS